MSLKVQEQDALFFGSIDVSNRLIHRTTFSFAFPAKMPIVPGHILVCPARKVTTMSALSKEELLDLFSLTSCIKDALKEEFGAKGFNTAWNEGASAGQTVAHLHLHIVPRKENDQGVSEYEPRKFLYRPGVRTSSPEEELVHMARILRARLS